MSAWTPAQEEAAAAVVDAAAPAAVVLIGAAAVDLHVPMHWRRTHDLDLALAVELDAFRAAAGVRRGCGSRSRCAAG